MGDGIQRQFTPATRAHFATIEYFILEFVCLQDMLEDHINECKFPPSPDAICRYQQCQARKMEIYFSDPDFKVNMAGC